MQLLRRLSLPALFVLGSSFGFTTSASAQLYGPGTSSLSTFAYLDAGNLSADGSGNVSALYTTVDYSPTGQFVATSGSQSFTGNNRAGVQQTMTLSGNAKAAADYGILHAYASAQVDNPYYNAANPTYFTGYSNGGSFNPNGSPQYLQAVGQALFQDTLTLNPFTDPIVALRYVFHIDGSVVNDQHAYAFLAFSAGTNSTVFSATSTTDWATPDWNVTPGAPIPISGNFGAVVQVNTGDVNTPEGVTVGGTADFYDTLTLGEIDLLDASGNLVTGATYLTASGAHYNIFGATYGAAAVPEPASLSLLASLFCVGAGYGLKRRRSRA